MHNMNYNFARKFEKDLRLCPGEFDNDRIIKCMRERVRFKSALNLISGLENNVNESVFSDGFTHHYFIHCCSLNDGLMAATAICNMIYKKYTYEIGDYLVKRNGIDSAIEYPSEAVSEMIIPILAGKKQSDCDTNEDLNPSVFLYHETNPDTIFKFDPEGIRVCFIICVAGMIGRYPELKQISSSPYQAAVTFGYSYIGIPADTENEIRYYIRETIENKGFDASGVKRKIRELSELPDITDERSAVSAANHIINNHIRESPFSEKITSKDFHDFLPPTPRQKPQSVNTVKTVNTGLVGLEKELETINSAINALVLDIERKRAGIINQMSGCNMVFTGQPGTAKTTIARKFAEILSSRNIIPQTGSFRECRKSDIIGKYIGHTADLVDSLFLDMHQNGGGVIFFDEIYTLSEDDSTCFDKEAVNCITQNMENFRSTVFCIFAGYEHKMTDFMKSNPGLSSRISTVIRFSPYDNTTLHSIFNSIIAENNFTVNGEYEDSLDDFFTKLRKLRGDSFGNGREARNLFENAKRIMADRVIAENNFSKEGLTSINADEIITAEREILDSAINVSGSGLSVIGF